MIFPNGFVDVVRTTNFTSSEDTDPARVNYTELLRNILSEVPLHFQNMNTNHDEDQ